MKGLVVLDRDGVLNHTVFHNEAEPRDSPLRPEDVKIIDRVPELLKRLEDAGFELAVASNQPSAAKGKCTREALEATHQRVLELLRVAGARVPRSYVCYHRAEEGCTCRKPRTGMLEAALRDTPGSSPRTSWMVGDRATDVLAGSALGFSTAYLGPGFFGDGELLAERGVRPFFAGKDLEHFVESLLGGAFAMSAIKLFSDGADLASLAAAAKHPRISGFTTNPTLMRKSGVSDYLEFVKGALAAVGQKPISFEVFADDPYGMARQARTLAELGPNVYVKIPVTNTHGDSTADLIRELSRTDGVRINVTAVCTLAQVRTVTQALSGGAPSVISLFAGRIADTGRDPMPVVKAAREVADASGASIEILWASPRELFNVVQAEQAGAHIITVPPDLLKKLELLGKDLDEFSLETVRMFHTDATSAGYTL